MWNYLLAFNRGISCQKKKKSEGKAVPSDGGYFIKQLVRVPEDKKERRHCPSPPSWGSRVITPPQCQRALSLTFCHTCLHIWLVLSLQWIKKSLEKLLQVVLKSLTWSEWVKSLSRVQLFTTPWTVAYQASLSMGFSRQEFWSGLPFPNTSSLTTWMALPDSVSSSVKWE